MPQKETGVHRRNGSVSWQLRIKAPTDLAHLYPPSGVAWRESLNTSDLGVANSLALAKRAALAKRFAEQRTEMKAQKVPSFTAQLAQELAARVAATALAVDERLRSDPETAQITLAPVALAVAQASRSALTIGRSLPALPHGFTEAVDPWMGMPADVAKLLASLNESANAAAAEDWASQRVLAVLPLAQAEARRMGFTFDRTTPGALEALRECLKSYRTARAGISARDRGEVVETPAVAQAPRTLAAAKGLTLRDVFIPWKAAGGRGRDAERSSELAIDRFEEWAKRAVPLHEITRAMGHEFKGSLLALVEKGELSSKTASDRMIALRTLLKFAAEELELLPRHPWKGKSLDIQHTTETPRFPYLPEHMQALSALPLFTAYELPRDWKAGKDAAYWLPLLAMYSGATVSELVQMAVADIQVHGANDYRMRITGKGEGQSKLKADQRERTVPLHPELIRLGLLDYWQAVKQAGRVRLWPAVPLHPTKGGTYFSNWWGAFRKPNGLELFPDFHSLRHSARSTMAERASVDPKVLDLITGHKTGGSAGSVVYTTGSEAAKRRAVESIQYEGLTLPRAFPPSAWTVPPTYVPPDQRK